MKILYSEHFTLQELSIQPRKKLKFDILMSGKHQVISPIIESKQLKIYLEKKKQPNYTKKLSNI